MDTCLLTHPLPNACLCLRTDASNPHEGAALEQLVMGRWHTLAFTSCPLTLAERCYSTFNQALLASIHTVCHFRSAIEGHCCILYMDHCPMDMMLHHSSDLWSPRQQHHLSILT